MKNETQRFVLFVIIAFIFLLVGKYVHIDQDALRVFFARFPLGLAGVVFAVTYVVLSFFIWIGPKDILKIIGAALFGAMGSSLLIWAAEMVNLLLLFEMSRRLGQDYVQQQTGARWQRWDDFLSRQSVWGIFVLRFFPVVPFRFLDLGMGLTNISRKKYFMISLLASPVRIFFVQYFLVLGWDTVQDPMVLAQYIAARPLVWACVSLYIVAAFVAIFIYSRQWRHPAED